MRQDLDVVAFSSPGALAMTAAQEGLRAAASLGTAPAAVDHAPATIDPQRLRLAQTVGAIRLRLLQEAAQQQVLTIYARHVAAAHEKQQQEEVQLALIMEAAEAQAAMAKDALDVDKEELHWQRRPAGQVGTCGHWQRGHCARGESCSFAHPPKEKGAMQSRGHIDIMRHNFKTSMCQFFSSSSCPHGARCMFAHGPQDLRSPGQLLTKEEEEMVHRVATAKITKGEKPAPLVKIAAVPAPAVVLPPASALQGRAPANLICTPSVQGLVSSSPLTLGQAALTALAARDATQAAAPEAVGMPALPLPYMQLSGVSSFPALRQPSLASLPRPGQLSPAALELLLATSRGALSEDGIEAKRARMA